MSGTAGVALALLEAALPGDLADAVVGDILEEFETRACSNPRMARSWLYREVLRSAVPLALLGLRRADRRAVGAALAASFCCGYAGFMVFRELWMRVLFLVPLRAGHEPTGGWIFFGAALVSASALLGAIGGGLGARRFLSGEKR